MEKLPSGGFFCLKTQIEIKRVRSVVQANYSRLSFFGRPGTLSPLLLAHSASLLGLWGTGSIVGAAIVGAAIVAKKSIYWKNKVKENRH
ncbi:hypothetical protein CHX27_02920 [Flavobacterium aurantiibacter]|uniref:Uncharacterized protein n=1 Tax=Flavobacterium aurantiibacter TaxID=2023067 RepID=A0A256A1Z3_9FLAO|nr:hypothetical protein CHX27_02920 [Flavobacterium aurantiibacter]